MPFHTVIRERRKELGLTQEQLAGYLGVTAPAVNKWERGNSYPDVGLLPVLARVLKTDLNTLLCFQQELTDQVTKMFLEMEMGAEEPVRYNRILAMLLSCTGVVDCTSMTVNGGTVNVPVEAEEVPALGTVSITTG